MSEIEEVQQVEEAIVQKKEVLGYLYIIQEREFIRLNEPVYKIGQTTRINPFKRLKDYPNGSRPLFLRQIIKTEEQFDLQVVESHMIYRFSLNFKLLSDYGKEYFEGDINKMIKILQRKTVGKDFDLQNEEKVKKYAGERWLNYFKSTQPVPPIIIKVPYFEYTDGDTAILNNNPELSKQIEERIKDNLVCKFCMQTFNERFNLNKHLKNRPESCKATHYLIHNKYILKNNMETELKLRNEITDTIRNEVRQELIQKLTN